MSAGVTGGRVDSLSPARLPAARADARGAILNTKTDGGGEQRTHHTSASPAHLRGIELASKRVAHDEELHFIRGAEQTIRPDFRPVIKEIFGVSC